MNTISHVTCKCNEACHMWMQWVMSRALRGPFCLRGLRHMIESRPIWMRHITYECLVAMSHVTCSAMAFIPGRYISYEWVMSRMNASRHICMSYVKWEWVMSRINESCHVWMRHVTYECVMSYHNESCHMWTWRSRVTHGRVMSDINAHCHTWMSSSNESCHMWTWMSHVTHERVMSHIYANCHTYMFSSNESCHVLFKGLRAWKAHRMSHVT